MERTLRLLAIDPGQTTGIAIGDLSGEGFKLIDSFEIPWPYRTQQLNNLFGKMCHDTEFQRMGAIVVERFLLYANKAKSQIGNEFPSVRVIGAVEMLCYQWDLYNRIVFQAASEISRVQIIGEDSHHHMLKRSEHCRDAYKHMRLWFVKNRPWEKK